MDRIFLKDCDYVRTRDNLFFIVKGCHHPAGKARAVPVFYEDKNGERHHPLIGKNFSKFKICENYSRLAHQMSSAYPRYFHRGKFEEFLAVPLKDIAETYDPREFFRKHRDRLENTVWGQIIGTISRMAQIAEKDIGIFGSYLLGFEISKDVDFLIYGQANRLKLKEKFADVIGALGLRPLSAEHNLKHVKKYSAILNPDFTDWRKIGQRRWSAIQVTPEILTTIRFVHEKNETPANPIVSPPAGETEITGRVIDDGGVDFCPRTFLISDEDKIFKVVSYLWGLQSCVKNGDAVRVRGNIRQDGRTISISDFNHGLKILSD